LTFRQARHIVPEVRLGEALRVIRAAAKAERVVFAYHAVERGNLRKVSTAEVLHVLSTATHIVDQRDGTYLVVGQSLGGKGLSVVVSIQEDDGVIVVTVWRNRR
jgi:hypothetical protein